MSSGAMKLTPRAGILEEAGAILPKGPSADPISTTRLAMVRHYRWILNSLSGWCGPDALVDVYVVERAYSQYGFGNACLALFVIVSEQP